MFKRIFLTLIFCLCVSGILVANTYGKQDVQVLGSNSSIVAERFDPQGNVIDPAFQSSRYQMGDTINIDFVVESQYSATSHNYSVDGFTVISVNRSSNIVNAKISYISTCGNATFSLFVDINNGDTLRADIFAFNTNHGIFLSQNSLDDARERAYDYMINNGFMTLAEREAAWRLNTQNSVINTSPMFNSYASNVNGRMTWKDDNNKTHPLQFIRIEIRNTTSILETTYTDVNGYFSTNLNPTGQVNVRIYPAGLNTGSASNVRVVRENSTEYFHEELNISYSSAFNREFDMTSDLGRAFQVSQATIVAARYARTMKGSFVPNVTVIYPHSNTGCSYSPGSSTMNITGNTAVSNGVRSYSSWDVIMHEYGHHVQHKAGYNIANNPAGSHSLTANLADSRSDKDIGIRLAWAESWPTFFGSVVQQYYVNASELDSNITSVGDAQYTSYNGASLNYPNGTTVGGTTTYFNGEASESGGYWCIMGNLYGHGQELG